jgi:Rrf2 family iron-sulfur cluster assembly transcriptional regulator
VRLDLALREQHPGPVARAAISRRQQISTSYLEQLFSKLRRHRLVVATRGPAATAEPPMRVIAGDIITAVDRTVTDAGSACDAGDQHLIDALRADLNARLMNCLRRSRCANWRRTTAKCPPLEPPPAVRHGISSRPVLEPVTVNAPNWVFAIGKAATKERPQRAECAHEQT